MKEEILHKTKTQHKPNITNDNTHKSYASTPSRGFHCFMTCLILFLSSFYILYTLNLLYSHHPCPVHHDRHQHLSFPLTHHSISQNLTKAQEPNPPTSLHHIVFGIAASAELWHNRKHYIKLWWRPNHTRGVVWLDKPVNTNRSEKNLLPPTRISADTASFRYTNNRGHRSAIRISRIVSETLRLNLSDVRWFVMGDDDTVFLPDNLVGVLARLDHRQFYYVGGQSESHLQNVFFSYSMAYGGGGFALSYPLAVAVSKMQDKCIQRYPALYGSDDRMQACMAELGVPLTRHRGFHQFDIYGDLFGLLAAHPVVPLVSLHHLDVVAPVLPNMTQAAALERIFEGPVKLDSAAVMQQSICYERRRNWTVSVSWGYAVQIIAGVVSPREMEMPTRTFLNWYQRADYTAYAFNTKPVARTPCLRPFVFYLNSSRSYRRRNLTVTDYGPRQLLRGGGSRGECRWKKTDPTAVDRVVVYKRPDPSLWNRAPRRNCCRVLKTKEKGEKGKSSLSITIDVGLCRDGEISEM